MPADLVLMGEKGEAERGLRENPRFPLRAHEHLIKKIGKTAFQYARKRKNDTQEPHSENTTPREGGKGGAPQVSTIMGKKQQKTSVTKKGNLKPRGEPDNYLGNLNHHT